MFMTNLERIIIYGLFFLFMTLPITYIYQNQTIFFISIMIYIVLVLFAIIMEDEKE